MGRLIDIDSLKGCAIIRPTSHETIEHIKQCGDDCLNHDDIPIAFDTEKVVAELKDNCDIYSVKYYQENVDVKAVQIEEAIDIVRKGGIE